MFNLLTEPLIRLYRPGGDQLVASLPDVYAALMNEDVESFPARRPHQRHAWHAFLVQLGAMAICQAGRNGPPEDADEWSLLIRGLTPDYPDDEPWHLIVEDITQPAFLQPPGCSGEEEKEYRDVVSTPDELDMLVTSKNHDLKSAVALQASPDDWVFALITLQTMEGFGGAGNYGISRMNSGLGNRPAFSLAPADGGIGAHVKRDINALLERMPVLLTELEMPEDGHKLLWILPWGGAPAESLLVNRVHPLYIEVCRRIRLRSGDGGRIHGIRTTSKAARMDGKALKGRTGDPWTPIDKKRDGLPLTLGPGGFNYKRVADYLTNWEHPALLRPTSSEQRSGETMHLVARAMVRGQGKTEGYHERVIPIRKTLRSAMLRRNASPEPGQIAQTRIECVSVVQRILSHAIQVFAARGDHDKVSPEHRTMARVWLNRLDEIVDARFFEDLQRELEAGSSERQRIRNNWLMNGSDGVIDHARVLLDDAESTLPCPSIHRYKARVAAEGLFEGRIRGKSGLPFLFDQATQENDG